MSTLRDLYYKLNKMRTDCDSMYDSIAQSKCVAGIDKSLLRTKSRFPLQCIPIMPIDLLQPDADPHNPESVTHADADLAIKKAEELLEECVNRLKIDAKTPTR